MTPDSPTSFDSPLVVPGWINAAADWVRAHRRGLLLAAVFAQITVLGSMIDPHAAPLVVGERILLHVQPVDPRDVFRGDYVVLSYDFAQLPPEGIPGAPIPPRWRDYGNSYQWWDDRTVYVSLEPEADGKHYKAVRTSLERPSSGKYLQGKCVQEWGSLRMKFGIEAFYVPEGEGRALEERRNQNQLSAEVALAPWGQAVLCELK